MASLVETEQRWNAARKKRNQSRYIIRERIKEQSSTISEPLQVDEDNNHDIHQTDSDGDTRLNNQVEDELKSFLKAITLGGISFFSLQVFSTKHDLLSKPFPADLLSTYKIQTLCTSRFGVEYADAVLKYKDLVPCLTMFEYALLLGEYGVAQSFITGGINPCDLLHDKRLVGVSSEKVRMVTAIVMKKLVLDFVPPSLAVYVAKRIYEMRLWSTVNLDKSQKSECQLCSVDGMENRYLSFPCCNHVFCEVCLWESLVSKLDERINGDVVKCPLCDISTFSEQSDCDSKATLNEITQETSKGQKASLQKFQKLPKTSQELRKLPKKRKMKKKIYSTWRDALLPTIGLSQDVRSDKFKRYIDIGAIHHCRTCIEEGVDINMSNEYNQTPLYIACWRNHVELVKLLLDWGASANIYANGKLSMLNVAVENGNHEIVQMIKGSITLDETTSVRDMIHRVAKKADEERSQLTTLIQDEIHPGYGAFFIDHIFTEDIMTALDELFFVIPIADATEVKQKKLHNNIPCSLRHYFCDAEGSLCNLIADRVKAILLKMSEQTVYKSPEVYVFPHMRFLNYKEEGGELLPHVDLTKVDSITGRRSTHTFILYLRDCEHGGETSLLKQLSSNGPKDYHEIIQQISPRRSRLLVFPHACPHQGMKVISTPKILLRGEILIT